MSKAAKDWNKEKIALGNDVLEDSIRSIDSELLNIMLLDRTTRRNILWATTDYEPLGEWYQEFSEITPDAITGAHATLIQPRTTKAQHAQADRTRKKAEVFTPSWICNKQNNLVDTQWFGRSDVFNVEEDIHWRETTDPISFEGARGDWKKYVDAQRLEISCGEAPYLVSRYDPVTGESIPLSKRIGLLDRKMRVVGENALSASEWLIWSRRAFESVYGYEYQGDNLLLARENLLYSYMEYYGARFGETPEIGLMRKIARVISWNIWQMDGLKGVVPGSCAPEEYHQTTLFDPEDLVGDSSMCPGCAKGSLYRHTGIYCRIMDWRSKCSRAYVSLLKGGNANAKL